jgi:hypothetical protein
MIYTDLKSLCEGIAQCNMDDTDSVVMFQHLMFTYYEALENPPQFVIGVGAISYAQEMLIKAQLDNV